MGVSFWAISIPEISSVLHFAPRCESSEPYLLKVISPNGGVFQKVEVGVSGISGLSLELNNILAEMLPDNGIRHARVAVEGADPGEVCMRIVSPYGHQMLPPMSTVSSISPFFAPKTFLKNQVSLLALIAPENSSVEAVVRLIVPGRAPEVVVSLNPGQTRLVHLQTEFGEVIDLARKNKVPAYLRVRARGDEPMLVSMFDQSPTDFGPIFQVVNL